MGGLSVLPALCEALPQAHLMYVADSAYAPYGERDDAFILNRSRFLAEFLWEQNADLIIMACNTATACAADVLRLEYPTRTIIGIEPGIKPATQITQNGQIGVMATSLTLQSQRLKNLIQTHSAHATVHTQACVGLAAAIENSLGPNAALQQLIDQHCQPLIQAQCDVVVLGCTHYPFVRSMIEDTLGPQVSVIDTALAVAKRAVALSPLTAMKHHATHPHSGVPHPDNTQFWTSGDPLKMVEFARHWLNWDITAHPLPYASD
jgi:glutamate racemase